MVKVKICGITNLEDAKRGAELGAYAVGFVFAKSPRQITPELASNIIKQLPDSVLSVGLFVNETQEKIEEILNICKLDFLQFHGDETPEVCHNFRKRAKVIKAFRIKNEDSLKLLKSYNVDGYLLDAYVEGIAGGTGKTFNWDLAIKAKKEVRPVILSGGLSPDNIAEAIRRVSPFAVDVSSGVEITPGKKDFNLMRRFFENAKDIT